MFLERIAELLERDGKQFLMQKVMQAISKVKAAKPKHTKPGEPTSLGNSSKTSESERNSKEGAAKPKPNLNQFTPNKSALLKELYTPVKRAQSIEYEIDHSKKFKELSVAPVLESSSKKNRVKQSLLFLSEVPTEE